MQLKYCTRCVMPHTKPFIAFNAEGVCNACQAHERKRQYLDGIDWKARHKELDAVAAQARERQAPFFDVLVPVSGGKDSITQVHVAKQYGLRILAVNVDYGIKTEIGIENLKVIPRMGATLITLRPEQKYHNELIRRGFEEVGDPDLMSHALLYAFPMWTAAQFRVPLVFWGENTAFEYGGDKISGQKSRIDRDWFYKYVVTKGITIEQASKQFNVPLNVLRVYDFPDQALREADVQAVFLSYFLPWDSEKNLEIAREYGFQSLPEPREGTFRNYVGIDEKINRIHQYMKVLKFGYGRASDHACEEIRNGRLSRSHAIALVKKHDREVLSDYFVDDFLALLNYDRCHFFEVLERYRDKQIWRRDGGSWALQDDLLQTLA